MQRGMRRPTTARHLSSAILQAIASHPPTSPALHVPPHSSYSYHDLAQAVVSLATHWQPLLTAHSSTIHPPDTTTTIHRHLHQPQHHPPSAVSHQSPSPVIPYPHDPPHRIAFLTPPNIHFVSTLLASCALGSIAVPLSPLYPHHALTFLIQDALPRLIVTAPPYHHHLHTPLTPHNTFPASTASTPNTPTPTTVTPIHYPLPIQISHNTNNNTIHTTDDPQRALRILAEHNINNHADPAILIYTSGTTGPPKGVLWTHAMLNFQLATLAREWRWSSRDHILSFLPLHHIHGLVNVLLTALFAGAQVTLMDQKGFSPENVWHAICYPTQQHHQQHNHGPHRPTLLMAVPTMYQRLLRHYLEATPADKARMRAGAAELRLCVCGSAPLHEADSRAWRETFGHTILERYGMTETGMTLANPYNDRRPACLGVPLPGIDVRVAPDPIDLTNDSDASSYVPLPQSQTTFSTPCDVGELLVRGPGVFQRYWRRPEETANAFTPDGWFKTGDVVRMERLSKRCYMLGRTSTDIIKTGGYKVSALEIEQSLVNCPAVKASAVVGIHDVELGQRIVAAVVPQEGSVDTQGHVLNWLTDRLPKYKIPREVRVFRDLPRNALGKVQKKLISQSWNNPVRPSDKEGA